MSVRIRRDGAYASTVLLTLALTIGAVTAVFSIVNGVLLRPLPYVDSHRLVAVREIWRQLAERLPTIEVNERHFEYWREHARTFESLAQYSLRPANLTGRGDAAQISVARASGSLFEVLKVPASIGRTLSPLDERDDAPDVATITDSLWRQRFDTDPQVLGRAIVLDGKPYTVVGVLPLFIASVGVYAVTSHSVTRRKREMNIRIALGARTAQVLALIVRQTTVPVMAGLIAGTAGAQAVGGLMTSLLFGVRPRDPFVLATVVAAVATVGVATCGLAAWRGLILEPATALRDE